MLVQQMVTLFFSWCIAEVLCRLLLGCSAFRAVVDLFLVNLLALFNPAPDQIVGVEDPRQAELQELLNERKQRLAEARIQLDLATRATDATEHLVLVEDELAQIQRRLAEIEQRREGARASA